MHRLDPFVQPVPDSISEGQHHVCSLSQDVLYIVSLDEQGAGVVNLHRRKPLLLRLRPLTSTPILGKGVPIKLNMMFLSLSLEWISDELGVLPFQWCNR